MSTDEILALFGSPLNAYKARRVAIGESRAAVYELSVPGKQRLFLKSQRREPLFTLQGEAERLRWLQGRAPVPVLVDFVTDETHDHLLMQGLLGEDAATLKMEPARLVELLAEALRGLHAIDIASCPFRHAADDLIRRAEAVMMAGEVDEDNFDPENLGRTPASIFAEMVRCKPITEDLVFTHGDFCLPNVIVHAAGLSGFIDVGTSGVGDRYRDLALVGRSLNHNLGPAWLEVFFESYGLVEPDLAKLRYYRLLDEFF